MELENKVLQILVKKKRELEDTQKRINNMLNKPLAEEEGEGLLNWKCDVHIEWTMVRDDIIELYSLIAKKKELESKLYTLKKAEVQEGYNEERQIKVLGILKEISDLNYIFRNWWDEIKPKENTGRRVRR